MYEIVAEISIEGCPPFDNAPIEVTAMNDNGVVVGSFIGCNLDHPLPFMWSEVTGFVTIPLPPGVPSAQPMGVNNENEIVGSLIRPDLGRELAFHWKEGIWTELPSLRGSTNTVAFAINDDGIIVGESANTIIGPAQACIWQNWDISALDLPSGPNSTAFDVSDTPSVVGRMGGASNPVIAFFWMLESAMALPTLPGTDRSEALAVNDRGAMTGRAFVIVKRGAVPMRSWVFDDGELIDLGGFPNNIRTNAVDLNSSGQVIGHSSTGTNTNQVPFLWQNGELLDIRLLVHDLPEIVLLSRAAAINQSGRIAVHDPENSQWLVLAPVDRPLGDVNIDCAVDEFDLIAVLDDWGTNKFGHPADMVASATFQPPGDGDVDAADLAVVLGNWTVSTVDSLSTRR